MKIEPDIKLDFSDVLIRPKRTIINSRSEVDLNRENTPEFDEYSWVPFWYPLNQVVDFKKEAYRSALIELKNQITK